MKRLFLASLVALVPAQAQAGSCYTPYSYNYSYAKVEAAYAVPVVPAVAVAVLVPAYAASFVPTAAVAAVATPATAVAAPAAVVAAAPQAAPAQKDALTLILAKLDGMDARIKALESGNVVTEAPRAAAKEDPFSLAVKANCLACHGGASPKGGLSLEGNWSEETSKRVIHRVFELGDMPPREKPAMSKEARAAMWGTLLQPAAKENAPAPKPAEAARKE